MASKNNKPFMTRHDAEHYNDPNKTDNIRPEYIARALLREAVENARATGNDIRRTLIHKVGLPVWMVDLAKKMDYSNLEELHRCLREGHLRNPKGISLAEAEALLNIKRYVTEELMTQPHPSEIKDLQFQSTIETAVVRKAERPQKTKNKNFTPEKGSWEAPDYDGGEIIKEDYQTPDTWVFPTEIVLWPSCKRVVLIGDLEKAYKEKMRRGDATGIPAHLLKYDVGSWVLSWKNGLPVCTKCYKPWVGQNTTKCKGCGHKDSSTEIYARPDKDRRNQIEYYKRNELRKLKGAIAEADDGKFGALGKLATKYLGYRYSRVHLKTINDRAEDVSIEKRIENQIRRKYNAKKHRVEGKTYLPPIAAGDMLRPRLEERVALLKSKNPKLNDEPWVILTYFDAEARENQDGTSACAAGVEMLLQRHDNQKKQS